MYLPHKQLKWQQRGIDRAPGIYGFT